MKRCNGDLSGSVDCLPTATVFRRAIDKTLTRFPQHARERLKAEPRTLSILYYQGEKAPCPCVVDGVMLATQASPGQGTVQVATEKAPPGLMAIIVIRDRRTGEGLRYNIYDEWLPKMLAWNKDDPLKRYDEAMTADGLFTVARLAPQ